MKILWVNPSFLDYRIPVYKRLYELTNGDFYILFSENRVPERIPIKMAKEIGDHSICFKGEKRIIFGKAGGLSNKWTSIPITRGLYKKIKEVNPDLIIGEGFFQWTPQAMRYAFTHKKPLLVAYERTAHTERECPRWRSGYRKLVDRFISGYLCNGQITKDYLKSLGIEEEKLYIGGMSADSEGLKKGICTMSAEDISKIRGKFGIKEGALLYLFVGQLIPRKGVQHLLAVWEKHLRFYPSDHLLLVGDGELYDDFKEQYGKIGSIHLIGAVDYDEIYKYYAISDTFIIPTLEDNWSLVVPEAMAVGLPVAVSIYNGCYPELCREGENGVLFDPLKPDSILKALETLHHVDLEAYGKRSIAIEQEYDHEHAAQRIFSACCDVYNRFEK